MPRSGEGKIVVKQRDTVKEKDGINDRPMERKKWQRCFHRHVSFSFRGRVHSRKTKPGSPGGCEPSRR